MVSQNSMQKKVQFQIAHGEHWELLWWKKVQFQIAYGEPKFYEKKVQFQIAHGEQQ